MEHKQYMKLKSISMNLFPAKNPMEKYTLPELVEKLRRCARTYKQNPCAGIIDIVQTLNSAADAIEELSAKVVQQNMEKSSQYYGGGWIPVEERLPEEAFGCIVTVLDAEPTTGKDYECILPYFVGYDGEQWNNSDGERIPFEVIAWQPLPPVYEPKED